MQDCQDDWLREMKLMWQIYSSSTLNISATAAANSDEGIFYRRSAAVLDTGLVTIPIGHPQFKPGEYVIYDEDEWTRQVETAKVNTRAWVLQERLLSPRILHFSRNQVFWECHEKRASERFPQGLPERYVVQDDRALLRKALQSDDQLVFLESWDVLVHKYTRCGLTKDSDKLAALSALARQLAVKADVAGVYLAGLWSQDLYKQLCWRASARRRIVITTYSPPSWSWASLDGEVFPSFDWPGYEPYGNLSKSRSMIEVLEATVETVDGDPFMGATAGSLRVLAPLFRINTSFDRVIAEVEKESVEVLSLDSRRKRDVGSPGIIDIVKESLDPEYTGKHLRHSTTQDRHSSDPSFRMATDHSAGVMATDDSSRPERGIPASLSQETTIHKFSFGDEHGHADMDMDMPISVSSMKDRPMYFVPIITKSESNRRFQREGTELSSLEGLIPMPDHGDGSPLRKHGVAKIDEYNVAEFLCELGNQHLEETGFSESVAAFATKTSKKLSIDKFMPEKWSVKRLDFIPKEVILYDILII